MWTCIYCSFTSHHLFQSSALRVACCSYSAVSLSGKCRNQTRALRRLFLPAENVINLNIPTNIYPLFFRSRVIVVVSMLERFFLSFSFFFLLCVAEKSYREVRSRTTWAWFSPPSCSLIVALLRLTLRWSYPLFLQLHLSLLFFFGGGGEGGWNVLWQRKMNL